MSQFSPAFDPSAMNFAKSLMAKRLFDLSGQGYRIVVDDSGTGPITGFFKDNTTYYSTVFDATAKTFTVTNTASMPNNLATINEFFIQQEDLTKIQSEGEITLAFDISTQMTVSNLTVTLYAMNGSTATQLEDTTIVTNPTPGTTYSYRNTYPASIVPAGNTALRFYIRANGYSGGTKTTTISNYRYEFSEASIYDVDTLTARSLLSDSLSIDSNSKWQGKTWNAVGDSITYLNYYPTQVSDFLKAYMKNYGVSGSTIAINNTYLDGQSFIERIVNVPAGDVFTIFGGTNDWFYNSPLGSMSDTASDTTHYYGALMACVENVLNRSNSPKLLLMTPLQSKRLGNNASAVPVPSAAPTLATATTGGSLAAATYYVKFTWVNANGETSASPEASITTTGSTSTITATLPALPATVTSANVYISTTTGTETQQGSTTSTTYTQSASLVTGASLPASNTATLIPYTMLDIRQAVLDIGQYYSVPVIDLYNIGGINPVNLNNVTADGVHPTQDGTKLFSHKIAKAMMEL